jgi:prephenate dehydrogenase
MAYIDKSSTGVPMKKYNLGVIGAGMYGKVLMRHFRRDERTDIVWVNSASEAATKSAADEFGVEKRSLDYRDVLNDPTVDAVVIATPPYVHAEQLEAALAAVKHREILFKILDGEHRLVQGLSPCTSNMSKR